MEQSPSPPAAPSRPALCPAPINAINMYCPHVLPSPRQDDVPVEPKVEALELGEVGQVLAHQVRQLLALTLTPLTVPRRPLRGRAAGRRRQRARRWLRLDSALLLLPSPRCLPDCAATSSPLTPKLNPSTLSLPGSRSLPPLPSPPLPSLQPLGCRPHPAPITPPPPRPPPAALPLSPGAAAAPTACSFRQSWRAGTRRRRRRSRPRRPRRETRCPAAARGRPAGRAGRGGGRGAGRARVVD